MGRGAFGIFPSGSSRSARQRRLWSSLKAIHTAIDAPVALNLLHSDDNPEGRERFLREARTALILRSRSEILKGLDFDIAHLWMSRIVNPGCLS